MNKTTTFFTKNDEKNLRLDKLLTIKLKTITRSQIKKIIDLGGVKLIIRRPFLHLKKLKLVVKLKFH